MEFKPYFKEILNKMETVKPSVVMALSGIEPENFKYIEEGHFKCKCPFPGHTDRRIGSFDLNDNKLIAKCFACGCGGRPVRFYRDLNGLDSDFEAAICMARDLGEITPKAADSILHSSAASKQGQRPVSKISDIKDIYQNINSGMGKHHSPKLRPLEIRSAFYTELVKNLGLNEQDRRYLMKERGIKEDELSDFFSFNSGNAPKAFQETRRVLGWTQDQYLGIPGVYESYTSKEDASKHKNPKLRFAHPKWKNRDCVGIVIRDYTGRIVNLQFRNNSPYGSRYVWLSSSFANSKDYDLLANGTSGIVSSDFEPAKGNPCKAIGITEGKFKAIAMARSGINTFSIQGVSSWKKLLPELENYLRDHPEQKKLIWLAFDADQKRNSSVANSLYSFYKELDNHGYHIRILDWDEKYGKGIDDVLANGAGKQIKSAVGETFIQTYILPLLNEAKHKQ